MFAARCPEFACTGLVFALWSLSNGTIRADNASGTPLNTLLAGGGPDVESNVVQIEGHIRFVASALPPAFKRVVLFANGKPDQPIVFYADTRASADAQRTLAILLADPMPRNRCPRESHAWLLRLMPLSASATSTVPRQSFPLKQPKDRVPFCAALPGTVPRTRKRDIPR